MQGLKNFLRSRSDGNEHVAALRHDDLERTRVTISSNFASIPGRCVEFGELSMRVRTIASFVPHAPVEIIVMVDGTKVSMDGWVVGRCGLDWVIEIFPGED